MGFKRRQKIVIDKGNDGSAGDGERVIVVVASRLTSDEIGSVTG